MKITLLQLAVIGLAITGLTGCAFGPDYMSTRAKRISAMQVVNGVTNHFEIVGWSNPKENNISFNPANGLFSFGSAQNPQAIAASGNAAAAEWEAKAKVDQVWANAIQDAFKAGVELGKQIVAGYYGRPESSITVPTTNSLAAARSQLTQQRRQPGLTPEEMNQLDTASTVLDDIEDTNKLNKLSAAVTALSAPATTNTEAAK